MLVPDLAGVIWLWPFTVQDHIYGRSNFGHRFCLQAKNSLVLLKYTSQCFPCFLFPLNYKFTRLCISDNPFRQALSICIKNSYSRPPPRTMFFWCWNLLLLTLSSQFEFEISQSIMQESIENSENPGSEGTFSTQYLPTLNCKGLTFCVYSSSQYLLDDKY